MFWEGDDMSVFKIIFSAALKILQIDLTVFGFTFSLFEVLIFSAIAYLMLYFIFRLFD